MNAEDREMLVETHTLVTQCHKALYGNGKAGLLDEMAEARGAYKTLRNVGITAVSVITVALGYLGLKG